MKKLFLMLFVGLTYFAVADTQVEITNVEAHQRYPMSELVDITVTIRGVAEDVAKAECSFAATNCTAKTAIPIKHITRKGEDAFSEGVWTRQFVWDFVADVGMVKIEDIELTIGAVIPFGVQLWENGPYWAEWNIGAEKPEEYGYYFWWGDMVGYKRVDDHWDAVNGWKFDFSFSKENCSTYGSSSKLELGRMDIGGLNGHDAAREHWGSSWRMPTEPEFSALINNCSATLTTSNGVSGCLITGMGTYASRSIFLPAAGYGNEKALNSIGESGNYWSSTPFSGDNSTSWSFGFISDHFYVSYGNRWHGKPVRPVQSVNWRTGVDVPSVSIRFTVDCCETLIVKNVEAHQRYPWNALVDIVVTFQGTPYEVEKVECSFVATNGLTKEAIGVKHVTRNGDDIFSDGVWTRRYVWDAATDVGTVKIENVALTVDVQLPGVQLWEEGPYWAECNVGATQPEERGYYFWWGDTVGYQRVAGSLNAVDGSRKGYSFVSENCPTYGKDNNELRSTGYVNASGNFAQEHDAAVAWLGSPWRTPTYGEFKALVDNCTTTWTVRNGVYGRLVNGKGAFSSKSIFIPAAGYCYDTHLGYLDSFGCYWTSMSYGKTSAMYLYFDSSNFHIISFDHYRYHGHSVRPVRGFVNVEGRGLTTYLTLDSGNSVRSIAADGETLRYDASWYADGAQVRIEENGRSILLGGAGCCLWMPKMADCTSSHLLKLYVMDEAGSVVGTETAIFDDGSTPTSEHVGIITKAAVDPTSSRPGRKEEITCSCCGEVLQASTEIPALGYIRNVTARQLWPHKKVEVCYEVAEDIGEVADENAALVLSYGENVAQTVLGDTRCTPGLHRVVWDVENEDLQPRYEWYRCTFKNVLGVSGSSHDKLQLSEISLYDASGVRKNKGVYVFRGVNTAPENLNPGDVTLISSVGKLGADSESPSNLFDGDPGTKWCMVNRSGYVAESAGNWQTIVFRLLNGADEVSHYTLSTANDDTPRCNPNNWIVEGSNDGRSWYRLDAQEGDLLPTTTYTESQAFVVASGVAQRVCVRYGIGDDAEAKGVSAPVVIDTSSAVGDGMAVDSPITLGYTPMNVGEVEVQVDGTSLLLSDLPGEFLWTPLSLGLHTVKHIVGEEVWTRTVNVTSLTFATPSAPNPPTPPDANITIKQVSHSFAVEGGAYSIPTAGVDGYTGGFSVSKSASWITINSAEVNWKAGRSIVYTVTSNDGAEERTGYVYVGGHVHTITQAGVGAELSSYSADVESEGGEGHFTVFTEEGISWNARPNANWITISPTTGTGEKDVTFTVAPWNDVSVRSATITVAGRAFTVNQIGRHMKLDKSAVSTDYNARTVELSVSALPFVEWEVESSAPWISIVDVGEGKAAGTVTLAVAENQSYLSRTASVRVGTETVTITQTRCPSSALNFTIDPVQVTAVAAGGTGIVTVAAAPGLPWSVQSKADWIVLLPSTVTGLGDGVSTYVVEPNPTMAERVEMITVSPETASELASKTIVVVQSAAKAEISEKEHEFAAKGESFEVGVSVLDVVQWNVTAVPNWVMIEGGTTHAGPEVVRVTAKENLSIKAREATIIIAGQEFRIIQSGRTVKVEPSVVGVSMSGGDGSINVIAEANVIWGASKSDMWISIWGDDDCDYDADGNVVDVGSGIVNYYVDGCDEGGLPRTGWIMVGDKRVSILQTREGVLVSVLDDPGAVVAGDMESGFVIKPSEGKTAVEVTIPQGVAAEKVTVEVSPKVESVKPNGAKVKVLVGENDITGHLVIPESDGVMNVAAATVKEEIVKETLDPSKDAVIEMNAANPKLITAPTRKGLTYTLYEGRELKSLSKGDTKLGDGNPWKPTITVSGGDAAFYSIDVSK